MTPELWALVIVALVVGAALGYVWWAHRTLSRTDDRGRM